MQNILIAGVIPQQRIQQLLQTIDQMLAVTLTVYTPAAYRSDWPADVTVLTGDLNDLGGLTAAVIDQDIILVQLDSKALVAQTQSLITVLNTQPSTRLMLASPDSILSLTQNQVKWYHQRRQRQQLAAIRVMEQQLRHSGLDFTLIEGTEAATTAIYTQAMQQDWLTAMPTRRALSLLDYLTVGVSWPLAA
ncbi:NAD(P)H-binding protein [Lactiplantibacillus songbeiensis]|uniref:NAD(P)H-binding protein n=1 Tax=Lactiplantibacillus songbeiensis TaxID=2559920 RepID=A0ABW4C5D4_9LACO|nr:NAD(P)H-binding protein [Lactiplantibacillus songbeiensis]